MGDVPIEDVKEQIGNCYQAVIVAARRTRQLATGAAPLVKVKCAKLSTLALWEIVKGKVKLKKLDEKE